MILVAVGASAPVGDTNSAAIDDGRRDRIRDVDSHPSVFLCGSCCAGARPAEARRRPAVAAPARRSRPIRSLQPWTCSSSGRSRCNIQRCRQQIGGSRRLRMEKVSGCLPGWATLPSPGIHGIQVPGAIWAGDALEALRSSTSRLALVTGSLLGKAIEINHQFLPLRQQWRPASNSSDGRTCAARWPCIRISGFGSGRHVLYGRRCCPRHA
jgi:hypothetical protein